MTDAAALVLVVEDEPLIMISTEAALEDAGFRVVTATNAAEAIVIFDNQHDQIRAVLTDIRLGDGMSGWDLARHVRETVATMPIVYVSGDGHSDWAAHGVPNSLMIAKPYVYAQIITAITSLMNQPDQLPSE